MLAYLHSQQMIKSVIPTDLGLSTAVWTRFGQDDPPTPLRFLAEGVAMGGWAPTHRRIRTLEICVKIHGTRYKPQEGPSEEPEVQGHLRRVRGVFLSRPGGSETHLIKEVTSGF